MVQQIIWNPEAEDTLEATVVYLQDNYTTLVAERFLDEVYKTIDKIVKNPESGRRSAIDEDVMIIKIDKFRIMYYDFDGVKITIHDFFDTRQDPNKRKY
jgi:plasmid stabilization system protein ParE